MGEHPKFFSRGGGIFFKERGRFPKKNLSGWGPGFSDKGDKNFLGGGSNYFFPGVTIVTPLPQCSPMVTT